MVTQRLSLWFSKLLEDCKYEIINTCRTAQHDVDWLFPALMWVIEWHALVWYSKATSPPKKIWQKVEKCFLLIVFKSGHMGKTAWQGSVERYHWIATGPSLNFIPLSGFTGLSSSCVFSFIAAWGISFHIAPATSICWKLDMFMFSSNVHWVFSKDIRIQDGKKWKKHLSDLTSCTRCRAIPFSFQLLSCDLLSQPCASMLSCFRLLASASISAPWLGEV